MAELAAAGVTPATPLLEVVDLVKHFEAKRTVLDLIQRKPPRYLKAVDGVSFAVPKGQTLGLVGESGCGKSTLGRALVGLWRPDSGQVLYEGLDIAGLSDEARKPFARKMQMVFQDPFSSLNPRLRVAAAMREVLDVHGLHAPAERRAKVEEILRSVGLSADDGQKYPGEFSGGQRQRIGIARALAVGPQLLVADEPVSALDVSIQAQILTLLLGLRESLHLTMLFISHDLRVVRYLSDAVAVMYLGQIVEHAPTRELFRRPMHPYTRGLLGAVPEVGAHPRRETIQLEGELPSAINVPRGCRFHPRCPYKVARCMEEMPVVRELSIGHRVACHLAEEI
jgi:oligopeptide/dipeptide ABC transporter ATP-binding protein